MSAFGALPRCCPALRRRSAIHPIPWFAAATVNGTYLRFNSHQAGLAAVPQADPEPTFMSPPVVG
jgi:hypothetical protein